MGLTNEERQEYNQIYYQNNKEKNKENYKESKKKYYENNKELMKERLSWRSRVRRDRPEGPRGTVAQGHVQRLNNGFRIAAPPGHRTAAGSAPAIRRAASDFTRFRLG